MAILRASTVRSWGDEGPTVSIKVLELLGILVVARVMYFLQREWPVEDDDPVLLRGDNLSAVTWVNKWGGL